jgi:hypothetical protein
VLSSLSPLADHIEPRLALLDSGGVQRLWRRRQCLPATDQIGRLLGNHDDRRVDVAADKIRLQASRKTTAPASLRVSLCLNPKMQKTLGQQDKRPSVWKEPNTGSMDNRFDAMGREGAFDYRSLRYRSDTAALTQDAAPANLHRPQAGHPRARLKALVVNSNWAAVCMRLSL